MAPFPIIHRCYDHHYVSSPALAKAIWSRLRQQKRYAFSWYATDYEITDRDTLTLYVYEIENSFSGGIGKCIHDMTLCYAELTPDERKEFDRVLERAYTEAAEEELARRERAARYNLVIAVRQELFGI